MPSISTITPATFDSGRSVTLAGSGFGASQGSVLIGGQAQTVTSWSDTSITFTSARGSQSMGACRVDVVPGTAYAWAFEGLSAGIDAALTKDESHGTVAWNAGGFARITYDTQGITDLHYSVPSGNTQILVQFDIRRAYSQGSKTCKIFSRSVDAAGALTALQPASYSGGRPTFTYSDNSNSGDNDCELNLAGAFRGGTSPTRTPAFTTVVNQISDTTVLMDTSGSVWETWAIWCKWNDDNSANGELAVWKNATLVMHLKDMWNCATTTGDGVNPGVTESARQLYQQRGTVAIGAYANVGGSWYEDYRNLKIGYTRPAGIA